MSGKSDGQESVEDIAPGRGVSYAWSPATVTSLDYTFKNDVDGEYNISLTLLQNLIAATPNRRPLNLVFGVARHRTVFFALVRPLN